MSVGCVEPGIWRLFQNAAGEYPQNSVRAREIRRNNMVRLTLAARRLVLVMAKNSVYASYTSKAVNSETVTSVRSISNATTVIRSANALTGKLVTHKVASTAKVFNKLCIFFL